MPPDILTPDMVAKVRGSAPAGSSPAQGGNAAAPDVLTPDMVAKFRGSSEPAPTDATAHNSFFTSIYNPSEMQASSNSFLNHPTANNGKGSFFGNAFRNIEDFGWGLAKVPLNIITSLSQFGGRVAGDTGNNFFNAESPTGSVAAEGYKGTNTAQKAGKTLGDVLTLATPGGPVGAVGDAARGATEAIPAVSRAASEVGTAGKVARFVPKAAGAVAESAVATPALTGHGMNGQDLGISVLSPFLEPALRGVGTLFRGSEGRASATADAVDQLTKDLSAGKPSALGKFKQESTDFANTMRETFKKNPNVVPNRILNAADTKLGNLEARSAAQAKAAGEDYVPSEKDVFNHIFDNGKIDGVNTDTGRAITTEAQARQTDLIEHNASLLQKLFASSNETVDGVALGDSLLKDINGQAITTAGGKEGTAIAHERSLANEVIQANPQLTNPDAKPGELFSLSKALRDAAYKAEGAGTYGAPVDTVKADIYRRLAAKIDEKLFNSTNLGVDAKLANTLRKNQAIAYSSRSVLQALERVKIIGGPANFLGGAFGAAVGYTHGGFFGGAAGKVIGEKVATAAANAYGDKKLASAVLERFANIATKAQMTELETLVNRNVYRNASEGIARKTAAMDAAEKQAIRDYIDGITKNASRQLPAPAAGAPRSSVPSGPTIPLAENSARLSSEAPAKSIRQYLQPEAPLPMLNAPGENSINLPSKTPPSLSSASKARTAYEAQSGLDEVKGAKMKNPADRRKNIHIGHYYE